MCDVIKKNGRGTPEDVRGILLFSATLMQVLGIRVYLLLFMYDVIKKNGRGTSEGCPGITGLLRYLDKVPGIRGPRSTGLVRMRVCVCVCV